MNLSPIDQLVEKEAVKEVRIMYSHFFDSRDADNLASLFTEDAICEFGPDFGGDWEGRETIRANFGNFLNGPGTEFGVIHSVTNPWVRLLDEATANARWYLHDLRTTEGVENPLILYGIYDDLYHKVEGRWLIHRTRIDFLWPKRNYTGLRIPYEG